MTSVCSVELDANALVDAKGGLVILQPDKDFEPTYETRADRADVIKKLMSAVKQVKTVYLASDPDREGEAIAWHIAETLNLKNARRIHQYVELWQRGDHLCPHHACRLRT